jgi:apolipoprotein N-acyltransferase
LKTTLLAIISGLLLAISWPTYGFSFFSFIGFVPLLIAEFNIRTKSPKKTKLKVFGLAYLSFLIWNISTTFWLYYSTPFGGLFAILANTLLMSLVFLIYHIIAKRVKFTAASSLFIALWLSFEKLHLNWEFSWPWLNLGHVFANDINLIQWYEYTGSFGGSLWILVSNIILFRGILLFQQHKNTAILIQIGIKWVFIITLPIIISLVLKPETNSEQSIETISLQPNVDPYTEKYHTNNQATANSLEELASPWLSEETQLLIAPETVFAEGIELPQYEYSEAKSFSHSLLKKNNKLNLLFGVSMYEILRNRSDVSPQSNFLKEGIWFNDFNSAVFDKTHAKTEFYHKSKLVVGVENFPYQSALKPILGDIMIDLGGTVAMKTTQDNRQVFELNTGFKIAPII